MGQIHFQHHKKYILGLHEPSVNTLLFYIRDLSICILARAPGINPVDIKVRVPAILFRPVTFYF